MAHHTACIEPVRGTPGGVNPRAANRPRTSPPGPEIRPPVASQKQPGQGPAMSTPIGLKCQHGISVAGRPFAQAVRRRSCRPSACRRARRAGACREMAGRSHLTERSDSGGRRCAGCAGARRCRRRRPRGRTADTSRPSRGRLARGRRRCAAAPTSWLLVLVLGGRRVRLGPIGSEASALHVGKLMAKNGHRQVGYLDAAGRALPNFLLVHLRNLATTSPPFHRVETIQIRMQKQLFGSQFSVSALSSWRFRHYLERGPLGAPDAPRQRPARHRCGVRGHALRPQAAAARGPGAGPMPSAGRPASCGSGSSSDRRHRAGPAGATAAAPAVRRQVSVLI
jgi:hypothetical protein